MSATPGERGETGRSGREPRARPPDGAILLYPEGRHLVFSLDELRALGLRPGGAAKRSRHGTLHRLHRGVYSPLPPQLLTPAGRTRAAVLAYGPRALLARDWAGWLWSATDRPRRGPIDVVVPTNGVTRRRGIRVRQASTLTTADRTVIDAIPVLSLPRTLLDLAVVLSNEQLCGRDRSRG